MSETPETDRVLGDVASRLLFENERVRIWELDLAAGERSATHRHDLDYVIVQIEGDCIAAMVFTVEPGLYVPADAEDVPAPFRGIGIRIEDDVLVTGTGVDVLSAAVPKQPAEIETLRAEAHA